MSSSDAEPREERITIGGTEVRVTSYRVGDDEWAAKVDDLDPGQVIGRGHGRTRADARREATEQATRRLEHRRTLDEMRESVERLTGQFKRGGD